MKKILSIMLCGLFTVFSLFLLWGTVFAQSDQQDGKEWNTTKDNDNNPQNEGNQTQGTPDGDTKIWINFWNNCFNGMWKWCFDYEKMIWIDKVQNQNITTKSIAQDILLAATYMVGTVLTIVIIFCWLMYIFAAKWWKNPNDYKKWLINAWIWAILVRWAYAIVRLIQYIAKW